jgi:hypothetical protein
MKYAAEMASGVQTKCHGDWFMYSSNTKVTASAI